MTSKLSFYEVLDFNFNYNPMSSTSSQRSTLKPQNTNNRHRSGRSANSVSSKHQQGSGTVHHGETQTHSQIRLNDPNQPFPLARSVVYCVAMMVLGYLLVNLYSKRVGGSDSSVFRHFNHNLSGSRSNDRLASFFNNNIKPFKRIIGAGGDLMRGDSLSKANMEPTNTNLFVQKPSLPTSRDDFLMDPIERFDVDGNRPFGFGIIGGIIVSYGIILAV